MRTLFWLATSKIGGYLLCFTSIARPFPQDAAESDINQETEEGAHAAMNKIRTISLCWLVFIFAFFLAMYVYTTKIWPFHALQQIKHFIVGDVAESLSLMEKIENDLNFRPTRHIKVADKGEGKWMKFAEGFESEKHRELLGLKLNPRRENPRVFLSNRAAKGYRLIYGAFDFDEGLYGAIMLDQDGRVAHVWHTSQEGVSWEHRKDTNVVPHGFAISPDGCIVTAYDNGTSLTKYDYCGNIVWQIEGNFHHSIEFEGEDAIWVWKDRSLAKIDYNTGKILNIIPLIKVMKANPDIDIFGILQLDSPSGSKWLSIATGYWHPNDIEPLPRILEHYYPNFKAGDLLVSLRSPNLVFVMDQKTLKVKWWRQGLTRRQHDPDWNDQGTVTIFNNNMHRGYSNIMEIDPVTYDYRIVLDGERYSFYTWWRGEQQRMPDGGFLVTSSDQGRAFETDAEGNVTFEFLNTYKKNEEYMLISEALFLPNDFFKELPRCE